VVPNNFDQRTGLPTSNRDQSCAFCGAAQSRFVHPLDKRRIAFRVDDKGQTLPTFWTTCSSCEQLITNSDDEQLLHRMLRQEGDEQLSRSSLAAFRAADLGSMPLGKADF
jgi:hypothetical protein